VGYAGLAPCIPSVVGALEAGMPSTRVGLKIGDRILAVDGQDTPCFQTVSSILQETDGKPVTLTVLRDRERLQIPIQPVRKNVYGANLWLVGIGQTTDMVVRRLPLAKAIAASWEENVQSTALTFEALERIVTRRMSARSLSGPVGIAQLSGSAYRAGLPALVSLVAFISLQLGIFNLLPIPMLDGGMITMLFIEAVMQRDLSIQFKEKVVQAGIFLLLLLVVFVTYNDIVKAIGRY
jgi:regulator of sigma E protease